MEGPTGPTVMALQALTRYRPLRVAGSSSLSRRSSESRTSPEAVGLQDADQGGPISSPLQSLARRTGERHRSVGFTSSEAIRELRENESFC